MEPSFPHWSHLFLIPTGSAIMNLSLLPKQSTQPGVRPKASDCQVNAPFLHLSCSLPPEEPGPVTLGSWVEGLVFPETFSLVRYSVGFALSLAPGTLWGITLTLCTTCHVSDPVNSEEPFLSSLHMLSSDPETKTNSFLYCGQPAWVNQCENKFVERIVGWKKPVSF